MNETYRAIKKFCAFHRRKYILKTIVQRSSIVIALVAGLGALFSLIFTFFPWTALPLLFDGTVIIGALFIVGIIIQTTVIHPVTLKKIAHLLELQAAKKHHLLSIALDFGSQAPAGSPYLVQDVLQKAQKDLSLYPKKISGVLSKKSIISAALTTALFVISIVVCTPSMIAWWDLPRTLFIPTVAQIKPGSLMVAQNSRLQLSLLPKELTYPSARLHIHNHALAGTKQTSYLLRPDSSGLFHYLTDSLQETFSYSFTLGNRLFGPETITVVPPPMLYSLQISLEPPRYTKKAATQLPEGQGSFSAYAGTKATFSVGSLFPLSNATLHQESGDTLALAVEGHNAQGTLQLWRPGTYTFSLTDTLLQKSDSLSSFYITLLEDYHPNVRIVKPGKNRAKPELSAETLWVEAVDDLGIRQLRLSWRLSGIERDTLFSKSILPNNKRKPLVRTQVVWAIDELDLYPGDTLFYWVYARDTKPFGKPQIAVSDTYYFRLPTYDEVREDIVKREEEAHTAMSSVQKMQEDMQERLESLIKSAKGKESLSWEEKKIVEDLGKSMKEQSDSLNQAVEALQEAVEKMQQSPENSDLLDKMNEVQKALKELIEEYGDSLFFKPPEDQEKVGWKDLKKAVDKMTDLLPDLKEHLENTLKFLEQLQKENERALLAQKAEELAKEHLRQAQDSKDPKALAKQKKLSNETDEFLKELSQKLSEANNSPVRPQDVPAMEQTASQQQFMQSSLSNNQMPSKQSLNQMSATLQSLSDELQATLSSTMMAKLMQDRETLLALAQDVLNLSQWQKALAESMGQASDRKLSAMEQQALKEALEKSLGKLDSLKTVPPSLLQSIQSLAGNTDAAMSQALNQMSSSQGQQGMRGAQNNLNSLASALLESANSISQSCSGSGQCSSGGMMGGLRKMSAKQAAINSATAEMLRQMMGQGGQPGQGTKPGGEQGPGSGQGANAEQARKAAQRAQKALADQLDQLGDTYGGSSDKSLTKRVKELEEEARRIAKMLKNPTPQVSERQDRFLVRLLQTSLSLHRQDEGKEERKSKSAQTVFSTEKSSYTGEVFDKTDTFYKLRMKALRGNFPESYRTQVQAYFDSLSVLFLKSSEE